MKHELAELEAKFPQFARADSPTQQVGDDRVQGFVEVAHRQKMLSLDNTYNEAEVRAFGVRVGKLVESAGELEFTVEPKIDGLAVSLTYEDGKLVRAVTGALTAPSPYTRWTTPSDDNAARSRSPVSRSRVTRCHFPSRFST